MTQNLKTCRTGHATAADTDAHLFSDTPGRLVYLSAPAGNTSDVTVLGVGADGTIDAAGVTLVKGGSPITWWCDNLNQLAFKLGTANDVVEWMVAR